MLDKQFIDRSAELKALRERLAGDRAEFMVIYGKRRVGKTALVLEAFAGAEVEGVDFLYLVADRRTEADQLREFSRRVVAHFDPALVGDVGGGKGGGAGEGGRTDRRSRGGDREPRLNRAATGKGGYAGRQGGGFTFESWEALFEYLAVRTTERRTVVAIDEFPYLCLANRALPSILQKAWDRRLQHSSLYLVLLGSSIAMMESEVLGYQAPLYGRRTGQLLLEPFSFKEARCFFPGLDLAQQIEFFAVAGGMPAYLRQLDPTLSLWDNLARKILAKGAFLNDEVEFVIKEELREPRVYMSLLREMAYGATKVGELAAAVGMDRNTVSPYLATLERLRLAHRELPVTERRPHRSRKGLWRLGEPFFRFYFRFMAPCTAELEQGLVEPVVATIRRSWPSFVAEAFEGLCAEVLWVMARQGQIPFTPSRVGRWWDKENEIDVVARDADLDRVLYGEVKWRKRPTEARVLEGLRAKAAKVKWEREPGHITYLLFSKAGFTKGCREAAARSDEKPAGEQVRLLGLEELATILSNHD